jgi:hypothetical protein
VAGEALNQIPVLAARIARLEPRIDDARRELQGAIRQAHADGASIATLAKLSNLSRQRVSVIVAKKAKKP